MLNTTALRRISAIIAATAGVTVSAPLQAAGEEPAFESAGAERVLDEVIVTSTRRDQTVSEVPLAITAFTGADLQSRGIGDLQDLSELEYAVWVRLAPIPGLSLQWAYSLTMCIAAVRAWR